MRRDPQTAVTNGMSPHQQASQTLTARYATGIKARNIQCMIHIPSWAESGVGNYALHAAMFKGLVNVVDTARVECIDLLTN